MTETNSRPNLDGIAIVGMSGRFPGAKNVAEFWQNLVQGKSTISHFSGKDLEYSVATPAAVAQGQKFVGARGVLADVDKFDAAFFGISPREAELLDPQHRVFLECAWEAIESAGHDADSYPGMIGVFAGLSLNTYLLYNLCANRRFTANFAGNFQVGEYHTMIGNDKDFLPTRVSFRLNLRGPSMAIQSACSTSLVAVCQACSSLLSYQCDMALAGGVSISFPQKRDYLYTEDAMVSPDGTCRTFDAEAHGTVFGHGAGVVLLKRLADAQQDGDPILAVITGSALNNDGGSKVGYAAPSVRGQSDVIVLAQAAAGAHPDSISYVEAHGTGTPLGDPIEVAALTQAFRAGGSSGKGFCALGSGKTHIGHLDAAAGVTGLIKTVLQIQHGLIPPLLNFRKPNPKIDFANSPFFPVAKMTEWKHGPNGGPRRAGVSAFGVGGTNAHLIVEEPPAPRAAGASRPKQLLVLSAKTETALAAATENLAVRLAGDPAPALADAAFTLQNGRRVFAHRRAVVASDAAEAVARLRSNDPKLCLTARASAHEPTVVFLFPGQGSQAVDMGRELYEQEPVFRREVDECARILQEHLGFDLRTILYPDAAGRAEAEKLINETRVTQPAIFVVEYALAQLWISWGIKPAAVIGHSIGEYVAAVLAETFTLADALALLAARARLMQELPGGSMLVVRQGGAEVGPTLPPGAAIAAYNSPKICTVSGPTDVLERLQQDFESRKIAAKMLPTSHAFHSSMMDPIVGPFTQLVEKTARQAPKLRWASTATGRWMTDADMADAGYWARQLRQAVQFSQGLATVLEAPNTVLLEVGPGQSLSQLARQHLPETPERIVLPTLDGGGAARGDLGSMLTALGKLWLAGVRPEWGAFYAGEKRQRVALPTYPFDRKRHWVEAPPQLAGESTLLPAAQPSAEWAPDDPVTEKIADTTTSSTNEGIAGELRGILEGLSGIQITSATASFLELGFDSLFLTQASQAFQTRYGVKVSFRQLLDSLGTLETISAYIESNRPPAEAAAGKPAEAAPPGPATISPTGVELLPLTEEQREIWLGARHSVDASKAFNDVVVIRLHGQLDHARLHGCLQALVNHHDALRTTFAPDGNLQRIAPEGKLEMPVIDLTNLPVSDRETRLQEIAVTEDALPFDLERGPLFRTRLVILSRTEHVLLFAYHHIVVDGWSSGVLLRELDRLYGKTSAGDARQLEPAMQFRELVKWQEEPAQATARDEAEKFWTAVYAQPPAPADLPTDRPRPAAKTFRSGKSTVTLDPALCRRIKEACGPLNCTFFQYLFAVYTAWLYRLTGSADQVVGVPVAGQISENLRDRPGSRSLVGHCVHFLPVRIACTGDQPFTGHLQEVRRQLLDARDNEFFTYGSLVKKLRLPRDPGRMPLVNVMFNLLPFSEDVFALENLRVRATFHPKAYNNFDLNVYVTVAGDALDINCEYNTALFDHTTIVRWQSQWGAMIESLLVAPQCTLNRLTLMTADEQRTVLSDWNHTAADYPSDLCLHQLFEAQAKKSPGSVAVVSVDGSLTYRELDEQAGALADHLRQLGVGPDVLVGICLERSTRMVVAVLGVLKAGGAYLPIDPTYPAERIGFMIEDAAPRAIVTQKSLTAILPPSSSQLVLVDEPRRGGTPTAATRPVRPGNLAYVRFTSGSTGRPKGVQIEHRAIVNFIESMRHAPGIASSDVLLAVTTLSFDISELEIHLPLANGARVVVVPWETAANGQALLAAIEKHGATIMQATPATWRLMLEAGWAGTPGLKILCGGEGMPADLARQLIPRCAELWNMYGPTETTVWSTCCRLTDPNSASIGRPIANTDIYIRDANNQFVPIGVAGELLIGGDGVARGYLGRPDLTAEKFIPHPFKPDERLYRTGDLARYGSNGQIDCLGRLDSQVKIRGFRIELGEIETTIAGHPDVTQAVVMAREDVAGDKRLVAYYTTREAVALEAPALRDFIRGKLPPYMLPSAFVRLEKVPLNPAGKVDRKQLPAPDQEHAGATGKSEPPATVVEEKLAAIWARILKVPSVGRNDNFFELGGNSLLAVAIFTQVEKDFGRNLPLAILFNSPTISGLARNLGVVEPGTSNWPSLIPIQAEGTKPRFFCVHGAGGNILLYRELVKRLGPKYPFFGFQSRGLDGKLAPLSTVEEMAESYVEELQRFQPHGPYCLGGYCLGGTIAMEMAGVLSRRGEEVSLVAMLDTYNFAEALPVGRFRDVLQRLKFHIGNFSRLRPSEMGSYIKEKIRVARDGEFSALFTGKADPTRESAGTTVETAGHAALRTVQEINDRAVTKFRPKPFPGKLTLFKPKFNYSAFPDPGMGWGNVALDGLEIIEMPLNPHAMLVEPFVQQLAANLAAQIDRVEAMSAAKRVEATA